LKLPARHAITTFVSSHLPEDKPRQSLTRKCEFSAHFRRTTAVYCALTT
jgi:hypothetical protein